MCSCSSGIEKKIHFCTNFNAQGQTLFEKIATIHVNILTENEDSIVNTLLFEKPNSENSFKSLLEFILSTERFNKYYSNDN